MFQFLCTKLKRPPPNPPAALPGVAARSLLTSPALAHLQSINADLINGLKQLINSNLKLTARHLPPSPPHSDFIFT